MKATRREFLKAGATGALCALLGPGCGNGPGEAPAQSWGGPGRRNGDFVKPRAIGVHASEVYVGDTTGRIQVFSESGEYRRHWSTPESENGTPTCIAFDSQGRVLVPDTHYNRILIYEAGGALVDQWGAYGSGPDTFIYPTGIAEGPDGTLYVSEYGSDAERIHVFDRSHRFKGQWSTFGEEPGRLNRAMAIALGPDGLLYVADAGNNRIQVFGVDGTFHRVIGTSGTELGQLKDPLDLAVAADGSVLVCEYGNHRISRFAPTGEFIASVGGPGRELGQFHGPRGVAVSTSGTVYVADTDNHRIQWMPLEEMV